MKERDIELSFQVNWSLDDVVPLDFFEAESLGNLGLGKYVPNSLSCI